MATDQDYDDNAEWDQSFPIDDSDETQIITKSRYYELDDLNTLMESVDNITHLSVLNINARSLVKHHFELSAILSELPFLFDVITVEETWLNDLLKPLVEMENYTFLAKHKYKCKEGGGIGIYIKTDIKYTERKDLDCPKEYQEFFDYFFIEIQQDLPKDNSIIGVFYRPPGYDSVSDFSDHINTILPKLMKENKNILITGDTNINLLKCHNHKPSAEYLDSFLANGFIPKITVPTRVTHKSATLIDHMFLNESHKTADSVAGTLMSNITDHYINFIFMSNSKRADKPKFITYRPYTKSNIDKLSKSLHEANFGDVYETSDPNIAYDIMTKKYDELLNSIVPLKTVRFNKYKHKVQPWMTKEILQSIKHRDKLHSKMKKTKNLNQRVKLEKEFSDYRSSLHKTIQNTKRKYENDVFEKCKHNSKQIWQNINKVIGKQRNKNDSPIQINDEGITITDLQNVAESFNQYYVNVGPNLAKSINSSNSNFTSPSIRSYQSFYLYPTENEEISKIIKLLKPKTSSGHDEITPKLLKQIYSGLISPLVHIINQSLSTGVVPDELKKAKVIPIFKNSGSDMVMKNYRPVSLLPVFSKILERIVYNRLFNYLVKHSILHPSQYGFQINLSTELAILEVQDRILNILDSGDCCVGIFMDLSKAFDTLDHDILLSKLRNYGVRGVALDWFRNYLSNRTQYVSINGTDSGLLPIECGVPQGSILGPLLFLVYINDLPNACNATTILFADDTNAIYVGKSYTQLINLINSDLLNISNWFKRNKMALNESKTKFIIFHKKHNKPPDNFPITLNGVNLERVHTTKFLGVLINENLDWSAHANHVCNKISRSTAILAKLKHYLPKYVLLTIYTSLCISHISYALTVWGGSPKNVMNRLRVLQKKGIRHVCNAKYNSHTEPLFRRCKVLNIDDLYKLSCVKLMYKKNKGIIHNYHASKLSTNFETFNTTTRQTHDIVISKHPRRHTRLYKMNSLNYKIGIPWNALPFHIKEASVRVRSTRTVKFLYLSKYRWEYKCKNKHCYHCKNLTK